MLRSASKYGVVVTPVTAAVKATIPEPEDDPELLDDPELEDDPELQDNPKPQAEPRVQQPREDYDPELDDDDDLEDADPDLQHIEPKPLPDGLAPVLPFD